MLRERQGTGAPLRSRRLVCRDSRWRSRPPVRLQAPVQGKGAWSRLGSCGVPGRGYGARMRGPGGEERPGRLRRRGREQLVTLPSALQRPAADMDEPAKEKNEALPRYLKKAWQQLLLDFGSGLPRASRRTASAPRPAACSPEARMCAPGSDRRLPFSEAEPSGRGRAEVIYWKP